jgi:hypothetical protein
MNTAQEMHRLTEEGLTLKGLTAGILDEINEHAKVGESKYETCFAKNRWDWGHANHPAK